MSKSLVKFVTIILLAPFVFRASSAAGEASSWNRPPLTVFIQVVDDGGQPKALVQGIYHRRRPEFNKSFSLSHLIKGRVSNLNLADSESKAITFRELAEGEYLADREIKSWTYLVDLEPISDRTSAAHVSWVSGGTGILMMRDLWPRVEGGNDRAMVHVELPAGWSVLKEKWKAILFPLPQTNLSGDWYGGSVDSVFLIGKTWRKQEVASRPRTTLAISGDWHFSSVEASKLVEEVLTSYERRLGTLPAWDPQIAIAKFPGNTPLGEWQAETRGDNITIISSDMPFKTQSLQRLHEQLRHELFHLWIPNGVYLSGNYDWFYEGFALYESLKLAVAMNRITFTDFLDTLSRAHTIDSARSRRTSLIEASKSRLSGSNTQVYARGMLVAFLTDLVLLERSKGNRSVENLLRELYLKHQKPRPQVDGNAAVIELLKSNPSLDQIISKYVTGTDNIDWSSQIALAGISDTDPGLITTLKVNEKLNGRQKTLLDKLGYNNWRKLAPDSK